MEHNGGKKTFYFRAAISPHALKNDDTGRKIRDNLVIHAGSLSTLKCFKDEVKDLQFGQECGMAFENYEGMRVGDIIECFRVEKVEGKLA